MLFILSKEHKFTEPEHADWSVQAYLPNPNTDPKLYNLVETHNPCNVAGGSNLRCTDKCDAGFPKDFVPQTVMNKNGYPKDGSSKVVSKGRTMVEINNQWMVPYNTNYLLTYNTHINVKICTSIKSIKYISMHVCI